LKAKEYASPGAAVNRSVDEDLEEFAQLFAQVVSAQKRGAVHPPQEFVDAFEQNNLGPRHVRLLISLTFDDEAQSVSRLAERIGLSLGTTSLMVGELARAGLVERSEDERDRRRTLVSIHPVLRDTMGALFRERTRPLRRALERMDPADRATFMAGWRFFAEETAKAAEDEEASV
jgi:DNA-binding MarR family transcriptional regulator